MSILGKLPMSKVLDHGFVRLVDSMGEDASIVQAARVSYGAGTKTVQDDVALVRYLMRRHHSTPFEMCHLKFHIKCPIFVARQWHRHRTASINEISARYSVLPEEYYVPEIEHLQAQSSTNKQGRDGLLCNPQATARRIEENSKTAYHTYTELLRLDVAREIARMVLPVNFYTEFYWALNLHNLMHFLQLRLDNHAQYEIRVYAEAIAKIVQERFPVTWKAFEDYRLNSKHLSAQGFAVIKQALKGETVVQEGSSMGQREWAEFCQTFYGE